MQCYDNRDVLGKTAGAVACGHCARVDAAHECPGCRRVVCEACLHDWTTCEVPRVRELRLGLGARLRSVDRDGRYGLVSRWHGALEVIDLRGFRAVETPAELPRVVSVGGPPLVYPLVTSDGHALAPRWTYATEQGRVLWSTRAFDRFSLRDGSRDAIPSDGYGGPFQLCHGERYAFFKRSDETVQITDIERKSTANFTPVPRDVLQAVWFDSPNHLLVTGVYGRVVLHRVDGDELEGLGHIPVPNLDIRYVFAANRRLAIIGERASRTHLYLHELDNDFAPKPTPARSWTAGQQPTAADMSPDGRHLAVALSNRDVFVSDLQTEAAQMLHGHTDTVHLVRFTTGGELITADCDNRVRLTPRGERGFVDVVIRVELG